MIKSVHEKWRLLLCLGVAAVWYFALCTNLEFDLFGVEHYWRVYNQMLVRLMAGRFDIDRDVIGIEAYAHAGRIVPYFGVFPALLRLPFLPWIDVTAVSLSRLSCWTGLIVCAWLQLRMLWSAHSSLQDSERQNWLLWAFAVALLFTGAQLTMTFSSWVYNEPIIWGAASVLLFYAVVLAGMRKRSYDLVDMCILAASVVAAFLCRPTAGLILLLTFSAIWAWQVWKMRGPASFGNGTQLVSLRVLLVPIIILAAGGLLAAWVNYERFDNPFTFINVRENVTVIKSARRMHVLGDLHIFEPIRLLPSFAYYFFGSSIQQWWPRIYNAYYDDVGTPHSALFAKEALLVGAALMGLAVLPKTFRSDGRYLPVLITGIGALISVLLMLGLPMVNYRYQMDLQPAVSLFAIIGYASLSRFLAAHHTKVPAFICAALLSFNIAFSHLDLLRGKFRNAALDESSRAELYKLTYPVSALLWIGPPPT